MKVLITTVPFGQIDRKPIELLEAIPIDYEINPLGRKLTENELAELVSDVDILIAGTEPITSTVIEKARKLKLIARVGIGLDSVDLVAARRNDVSVSYTPDAPSKAVADLTIGLMFALLRSTQLSNLSIRNKLWKRYFGRRLSDSIIGVIGAGRIGKLVIRDLTSLGCENVLVNDTDSSIIEKLSNQYSGLKICAKEDIYNEADVITIHVPLSQKTRYMIRMDELMLMKKEAVLVNTSRGGIVSENDLCKVMLDGHLAGAAIDVFETEPYKGPLVNIERCILTAHMGSMSIDCRARMEIEAVEEVVRFVSGEKANLPVPQEEYENQFLAREQNSVGA